MKFKNIDGRTISINLAKLSTCTRESASKGHQTTAEALTQVFDGFAIYQEVYIDRIYLDFFIPLLKIVIEVDGIQHDKYTEFFHKDGSGFLKSIKRDEQKEDFCKKNGLKFIRIVTSQYKKIEDIIAFIKNNL